MADIGGIAKEAPQWIFIAMSGGAAIGIGYFYHKIRKDAIAVVEDVKARYSESLSRENLISFYQQLNLARANLFFGERMRQADELFARVKSRLGPIINHEISGALQETDLGPGTALEDLSDTYRQTLKTEYI